MKKMVVLNHKSYLNFVNVKDYIIEIKDYIRNDIDVIMCPSNIFVPFFHGKYNFSLGIQNIGGVFCTGEITGELAKSMGVNYCIVGHGERKVLFGESNRLINLKIKDCIENGINPIVCVGETLEERSRKKTQDVIVKQIREYFHDIDVRNDIVICYEPIWAINTDNCLSNDEIKEIVDMIKTVIYRAFHVDVRVLYGGGINERNIKNLIRINNLDGFMLGKVSVEPRKVLKIINSID